MGMPRIPALLMLQLTWDTLREVGFTTTCAPTLAAEGRPKSNTGVVVSSACAEGVETGLDAALFATSVFEPLLLFGSSGGVTAGLAVGAAASGVGMMEAVGSAGAVTSSGVGLGVKVGQGFALA